MSAAPKAPGVAKARERKYEPGDGHEHKYRGASTTCVRCGEEETSEQTATRKAAERRERREGQLPDARHQIQEKHRLPKKDVPMTQWRADRLELVLRRSRLGEPTREVGCALLVGLDWTELIYYLGVRGLAKATGYSERRVRIELAQLAKRGVILRSTADDRDNAPPELRHLHYDAHDDRLIQPKTKRDRSAEWIEGFRLYEWVIMGERSLADACASVAPPDPGDPGGADPNDQGGPDPGDPGGADPRDPAGPDPEDPAFHREEESEERESLDPDPHSGSAPSENHPSETLSDHRGTSPDRGTATPGADASPQAARNPGSQTETPPAGREAVERGDCKDQTGVGGPEAAQEPQSASAWSSPPVPPATREELAAIAPVVAAALAARTLEGKPIQLWPGPATSGFVKLLRKRNPPALLLQYVVGVARGEGPEAESARGGRMPLAFAADRVEYFASLGRRVQGGEIAADIRETLAKGPPREPDTPDVAGGGGPTPAEAYAAYLKNIGAPS